MENKSNRIRANRELQKAFVLDTYRTMNAPQNVFTIGKMIEGNNIYHDINTPSNDWY